MDTYKEENIDLNLSPTIVYYSEGHKCDHCGEINKGMYQVKDKTLCIGCYHLYIKELEGNLP